MIERFVKAMLLCGNEITTSCGRVPNGTHWVGSTCCPNLMLLASPWLEIFRLVIADFEQFKIDSHFAQFRQSKINVYRYQIRAGHNYFTNFRQDVRPGKTIQTLTVWQKIQEPGSGSGKSHFQWFNQL